MDSNGQGSVDSGLGRVEPDARRNWRAGTSLILRDHFFEGGVFDGKVVHLFFLVVYFGF